MQFRDDARSIYGSRCLLRELKSFCNSSVSARRCEGRHWPRLVRTSIESTSVSVETIDITVQLTEEIVELAFALALCHFKLLRIDVAAAIYFNLFRALICTRSITNKHFLLAKFKLVIKFFTEIYHFERVIEIYRELFVWMPICFVSAY